MKTEDLYLEYARVIKMCEGTNVKPWQCIKGKDDYVARYVDHPLFKSPPDKYEFAIAILEDKPVFVGDKIFSFRSDKWITVQPDDRFLNIQSILVRGYSWKKPEPKRTFTLNGVELPCPVSDSPYMDCEKYFTFGTKSIMFDNKEDRDKVFNFIGKLLSDARDKS